MDSHPSLESLTPRRIVEALDRYIIGQMPAKRAVAIAMRNRYRRQLVEEELRQEISPKNILMSGPTGVGKTEIARRLANLAGAPFVKIEATKFTEVGYVGRDVESMIRDLVEISIAQVKREESDTVETSAESRVEERLLDALLPQSADRPHLRQPDFLAGESGTVEPVSSGGGTREKLRALLRDGKLDERQVELEMKDSTSSVSGLDIPGLEAVDFKSLVKGMMPERSRLRSLTIKEARPALLKEEVENLLDMESIVSEGLRRAESGGIVFIDEIDKITAPEMRGSGPDVSREGVQRDILPIIEGTTVTTKHGSVKTDHILFIAAGAFNLSKPSDLIPELQGRFPLRVELDSLSEADLRRILVEPRNALTTQYRALLGAEGIELEFLDDGIDEIAAIAQQVNSRTENIGARRLHTVLEKLLEEPLFDAPESGGPTLSINQEYVQERLADLAADEDLSKFIL